MKSLKSMSSEELLATYKLSEIAQEYTLNEGKMGLEEDEEKRKERIIKTNRYLIIKQALLEEIEERLKTLVS